MRAQLNNVKNGVSPYRKKRNHSFLAMRLRLEVKHVAPDGLDSVQLLGIWELAVYRSVSKLSKWNVQFDHEE